MLNKNKQNLEGTTTILINSCDLYEDVWEPCLDLMYIQWKNLQYPVVINTETKDYLGKHKNVRALHPNTDNITWSKRLKYVLEQIDTPYILFTLEDYFLLNEVNDKVFCDAIDILNKNDSVGMICLSHSDKTNIKTDVYECENFYSRVINTECKIWCRINLYRKDFLIKLLKMHENIWEFEQYASYRARKTPYIILQQNNNEREVFTFKIKIEDGYGITLRKWLPNNVPLFQKYNISVNYEKLGMWEEIEKEPFIPQKEKTRKQIREFLYEIKHFIKISIRKIKKNIRMIRSMR